MAAQIDPRTFRQVLGQFCTGITIITTVHDDVPVGFACQSFAALSLEPPLVLFCPTKVSRSWKAIEASGKFCVNVLTERQKHVSARFGSKEPDKFAGIDWRPSELGSPVIDGSLAYIDCTVASVHDGGDHFVVFGAVNRCRRCPRSSRGRCCSIAATTPASSRTRPRRPSGATTWRRSSPRPPRTPGYSPGSVLRADATLAVNILCCGRRAALIRFGFVALLTALAGALLFLAVMGPWGWWIPAAVVAVIAAVGIYDLVQRKHSVLRNYPVLGHMRFLLEALRPEMQQYFIERNFDGRPFDRDVRSLIYERAKGTAAELAFGTERDIDAGRLRISGAFGAPGRAPRRAVPGASRWARLRATVRHGADERLGDELRRAVGQRPACAEQRRPQGPVRPRHGRRWADSLSSRRRRRGLGDRLRLFRRPHRKTARSIRISSRTRRLTIWSSASRSS